MKRYKIGMLTNKYSDTQNSGLGSPKPAPYELKGANINQKVMIHVMSTS
jgi:hypothetical protein